MDDGTLRERLWQGFARLQTLLGGEAAGGVVVEEHGIVASFVPGAPDSPTLNAAIVVADELDLELLDAMRARWEQLGVRRWGVWTDGAKYRVTDTLRTARMRVTSVLAGHGAPRSRSCRSTGARPRARPTSPPSATSTTSPTATRTRGWSARSPRSRPGCCTPTSRSCAGRPASVALALHHEQDCGISFVATAPHARRQGLASDVMQRVALDAREAGLTSTTLQATNLGEKLYLALGYRKVSDMQLWERRR